MGVTLIRLVVSCHVLGGAGSQQHGGQEEQDVVNPRKPREPLRTWASRDGEWGQYLADAYAFAGDGQRALEWLRISTKAGFLNHEYLSRHDPFIAPFRSLPEWVAALQKVEREWERFEQRLAPLPTSGDPKVDLNASPRVKTAATAPESAAPRLHPGAWWGPLNDRLPGTYAQLRDSA